MDISSFRIRGQGTGDKSDGWLMVFEDWDWFTVAHELGHAFGLLHDFRDYTYIMSYGNIGRSTATLSACAAEFLSVHPYFDSSIPLEIETRPTVELISPTTYPTGAESVTLRVRVRDDSGLHQVMLFVEPNNPFRGNTVELKMWQKLDGETDTVVEFNFDGRVPSDSDKTDPELHRTLANTNQHEIRVMAVDTEGNWFTSYITLEEGVAQEIIIPLSGRTPQVRNAIVAAVPGINSANDVTAAHLAAITSLSIRGSDITRLRSGDFDGLTGLTTLIVGGTKLSSLPTGIFDNLTTLTEMYLGGNNDLNTLPSGIFDNLTALKKLYLSENGMPSLRSGVFDNNTTLEEIGLKGNDLRSLPLGIFDNLTALKKLDMSYNELVSLRSGIFDNNTALTELHLYYNDLNSLPSGIFDNNTALTTLTIWRNNLSSLSAGIFDNNTALTNLSIGFNNFSSLPSGIFEKLTNLIGLGFLGNRFRSLPNGIFKGLPTLTSLNVSQNPVDPLPLTVSLEKVADGQFKAVAPTGAPFDIVLPLTVTDGSISGGATSVTIPVGSVESETLTVTRTTGASDAVSVWIGTLPSLPQNHSGYRLVNGPSLEIFESFDETIWSGTITVGTWRNAFADGNAIGIGYSRRDNAGSISNPTFTYRGTTYTINGYGFAKVGNNPAHELVLTISPGFPACDKKVLSIGHGGRLADTSDGSTYGSHTYFWQGRWAIGAQSAGSQWRDLPITLHPTVPDAPAVSATNESNQVTLSWETPCDGGKDITHHEYRQRTKIGIFGSWMPIPNSAAGGTNVASYTITSVNNPEQYVFEVRAVNQIGEGSSSAPVSPSDRTPQVAEAILNVVKLDYPNVSSFADITDSHLAGITALYLGHRKITALKSGDFDGLTGVTELRLLGNQLTSLPADIFDELTALTTLRLNRNRLTSLPDGIFEGLTGLTTLYLGGNAVNPLPLTVSLEKVGADQFKAVVPVGAPFDIVLPLSVSNGSVTGGATSITIPAGSVESGLLTVTRYPGTTAAVSVNIGSLPGLPSNHYGYALVKSPDLPLEIFSGTTTQVVAVNIPDANLRAKIETTLGKTAGDPISAAEMATLTSLSAGDASISNLTGLETATNLTTLKLGNNNISDISAIAGLTKLTELQLWDNTITNISALAGLTNLTRLYLWGNTISDISHVAGLTDLTRLYLGENSILNISAVAGLTKLTHLYLNENSLSNISAIAGLTNLTELRIGDNTISNISAVANLTNLVWLDARNNAITDISALTNLTNLTTLTLTNNAITNISSTTNLTKLVEVFLGENSISGLSPLVSNTGLGQHTEIDVQGNPLSYPSIYTHIPALQAKNVYVDFDNRVATAPVKISGDIQQGNTGTALAQPFVVEVRDGSSVAFAGVPVTFAVTAGGGSLSATNTTTDVNGRAESTLTLGNTAGTNTVRVSVTGITQTITFTATGTTAPIVTVSPIINRTSQVRDAIVAALPGINSANDVTEAHLATITSLNLKNKRISTLKTADFDGLSALTELRLHENQLTTLPANIFSDLSSLRTLYLNNNRLSSLPSTVFSGLSSLSNLYMNNNRLTSLPETVFSGLTSLRQINLHTNHLTSLPADQFSGLSSLTQLYLHNNRLASLSADVFSGLSSLVYLYVNNNKLTSLPTDVFSDLPSLTQLLLNNNQMSDLSADMFRGLSTPTLLWLNGNAVDPLPLTVSLEKVGLNQFKATVPAGAPFTLVLPLRISNGSISGAVTTVTIPAGDVESQTLTVTRTPGTNAAVTVDIGTLPGLPTGHKGYQLAKSVDLPLTIISAPGNNAPVFTEGTSATRTIAENTATGVNIGNPVAATDADNDTLTYTLSGTDSASFSIVSNSGQLQTRAAIDYETKTTYTVTVAVSDGSLTDTITVTINVTDIDELPTDTGVCRVGDILSPGESCTYPDTDAVFSVLDNGHARWNIPGLPSWLEWANKISIGGSISFTATINDDNYNFVAEEVSNDSWEIKEIGDDSNQQPDTPEQPGDVGETPILSVSTLVPLTEATLHEGIVTLTLSGGTFDHSIFTIRDAITLTGISGVTVDTFGVDRVSDTQATVELVFDGNMTSTRNLTISLGVDAIKDYDGAALTAQMSVSAVTESVTASTAAPLTEATLDESVVTLTLSGRKYERWSSTTRSAVSVSGISAVTFPWHDPDKKSDTEITIELEFDGDITTDGILTFTVGAGAIAGYNGPALAAQVPVSVGEGSGETDGQTPDPPDTTNSAPVFSDGTGTTRTIAENTAAGVNIGAAITATDADNDTLTYSLGGTDAASFSIGSTTGQLQTRAALDYETKTSYTVTVTVSDDNGGSDSITVTINITDVNESPITTPGTPTLSISTLVPLTEATLHENVATLTVSGGTYESSVFDIRDAVSVSGIAGITFQWGTVARLSDTEVSLELTFNGDMDIDGTLLFTVGAEAIANYNGAALTAQVPVSTSTATENYIEGPWLWMIASGADIDSDRLAVKSGGTITEAQVSQNGVNEGDNLGNLQWTRGIIDQSTYCIFLLGCFSDNVNDLVNEIGLSADSNLNQYSAYALINITSTHAQNDVWMGVGSDDAVKVWLNGEVVHKNDVDRRTTGIQDRFRVNLKAGDNLLLVKVADNWQDWGLFFRVYLEGEDFTTSIPTNTDGQTPDPPDTTNSAPVFSDGTGTTRTIAENTAAGVNIGAAITATDADNDTLTYSLGGTDAASFSIGSTTGQLQTRAALDYETKTSYTVTVTVSDDNGGSDSITVTINITDVNESPTTTPGTPTLTASTTSPLTELTLDESIVTLTLSDGTYERSSFTIRDAVTVSTGISGITVKSFDVDRESDTEVTVELTFDGTDFDTDSILTFTVGAGAIADYDGAALTAQIPVTAVTESITASTTAPLTEATLDESVVTLTLSGRKFERYNSAIRPAVSVSGISGVTVGTFGIDRVSDTEVTVELTFDGDITTDGILTFTVGVDAIAGYNGPALTAQVSVSASTDAPVVTDGQTPVTPQQPVTPEQPQQPENTGGTPTLSVTTTSPLTESTLHEGIITLTLSGGTFERSSFTIKDAITLTGITGVTVDRFGVDRVSDTQVTVELAFAGNMTTDSTLTISVGADAIKDYDGTALTSQLSVSAVTESVTASTAAPLTEATLHESVVTLTLNGAKYARSIFDIRDAVTVSTGIAGVTVGSFGVRRVSDTQVTVELEFDGTDFDTTSTLTFTVEADAIAGYNGPALTAQISVTANTESVVASTASPLTEATLDESVVTLTLSGRTFERSSFKIKDAVTVSGIAGVTVGTFDIDRVSDTQITVELTFDGNINTDSTLTFTVGADAIVNYSGSALTAQVTVTADRENALLANYPNPFNPETWIPYRLAEDAFVTLTIYDQGGQLVRTLDIGHRMAGFYETRSKAIYWDGRNQFGEQVASGVYFYHLSAGDYYATQKMLVLK